MVFFRFFWKSALVNPEKLCKIQILRRTNAGVAQLVERNLAKVEVAGPSPVFRSGSLEKEAEIKSKNLMYQ